MFKRQYKIVLLLFSCLFGMQVQAEHAVVIYAPDSGDYEILISNLTKSLDKRNIIHNIYRKGNWGQEIPGKDQILITIGTDALVFAGEQKPLSRIYATGIPKINFNILLSTNNYLGKKYSVAELYPLYIEQPVNAYLSIIAANADMENIAVFHDDNNINTYETDESIAESEYAIEFINVDSADFSVPALNKKLMQFDLVILQPGKYINSFFVKWLLNAAFEQALPVFTFSSNFLDAGAAISIETDLTRYHEDILLNLQLLLNNKKTETAYPSHGRINANKTMLRYLGLDVVAD